MVFQWLIRHLRQNEHPSHCDGIGDFCPWPATAAVECIVDSTGEKIGSPVYLCSRHLGIRFTAWMPSSRVE
jgi:hypothetical protein